jgi:hypothetical protein
LAKLYACFPESDTEAMSFCVRREMAARQRLQTADPQGIHLKELYTTQQ